jgi:MobA/VirD2-like, nuclease domain
MIAKGNLHDGRGMAAYLMTAKPGERAELAYAEGFAATDLRDAFRDVEIASHATRAQTPFFHCYTRFAPGEMIDTDANRKRCLEIARRELKTLGMAGQPYAVSFHTDRKTRDMHMHFAVSRIAHANNGRFFAIDPGLYKNKLKHLSRECERDYGLREVSNDRPTGDLARASDRKEFEESRRLGTDIRTIRTGILDCFQQADNGNALKAALEDRGMMLANGDRRDCFVVIDTAGGQHALNKKLTGLTLAQTRGRLADLDRSQLPSVTQAKELQAQRHAARVVREQGKHVPRAGVGQGTTPSNDPPPAPLATPQRSRRAKAEIKPLDKTAARIGLACKPINTGEPFAPAIDDQTHYKEVATDELASPSEPLDSIKYDDEPRLSTSQESITSDSAIHTDNSPAARHTVADGKQQPKPGLGRAIRQLFRQAIKVLTGRETEAPTPKKSRRRGGEETGPRLIKLAPRAFRSAKAILSRSRSVVRRALLWDTYDPLDTCNPLDPAWQPLIENHPPFDETCDDHQPPPDCPSPNL